MPGTRPAGCCIARALWDQDISERKRAEDALRLIAEGTSSAIGDGFFRALVKYLAHALRLRFAFVAELVDPEGGRLRLVSFWTGADYGETFEYSTKGTPCELVVGKKLAYYPAGVQELFPGDRWLQEMGIESYLAVPLFDSSGNPLGHLGVMHDERMHEDPAAEPILRIFAARAGAEVERKRAEEALRESEEKYRTLFELASDAFLTALPSDWRIIDANLAAAALLGYSRGELIGLLGREHIIAPEVLEETERECQTQLEQEGQFLVETVWVRKDSTRVPVAVSGKALEVRGQLQFQLIGREITERKRLEEALQRAREELEGQVERQMLRRNPYGLTFREFTVLHLVAAGRADKEIARELNISPLTVHKHVANILAKMNAASRTEAGVRALREGLLN